jgi:hypothetical protein
MHPEIEQDQDGIVTLTGPGSIKDRLPEVQSLVPSESLLPGQYARRINGLPGRSSGAGGSWTHRTESGKYQA